MAEQAAPRYISAIAAIAAPAQAPPRAMSSIGSPDPRLTRAGLEPLNGQVSLDELRSREQGAGAQAGLEQLQGTASASPYDARANTDLGEDVLNATAWDGVADGQRLLGGDSGFESRLGAMDLSTAADSAADAILAAIG
jgi:hypothetical protein